MNKEDKQLLLVDLCARLPYGVICDIYNEKCTITEKLLIGGLSHFCDDTICVRPYLRPISSMSDEEMDMLFDILHIDKDGKDDDWIKINDVYGIQFFFPTGKWVEDVANAYDYLNSIHIDFRGLISKGLAIAVTKENNPYENVKVKQYEFPVIKQWEWDSERGCSYPSCQIDYTENDKNI